jgi:hypothetical protein
MKLDRELVLGLSFLVLSVGSTAYIFSATTNYLLLYPALGEVQAQVDSVSFTPGTQSTTSNLTVQVTTINPSDYSGLKLGGASVRLYFFAQENKTATLFSGSGSLTGDQAGISQFRPRTTITMVVRVLLDNGQADALDSFYKAQNGMVMANVDLTVDLITFLDSVTGRFQATAIQNVALTYG